MKILNLSFDPASSDPNSKVAGRFKDYGNLVKNYTVLTLSQKNSDFLLTPNVRIVSLKKSFKAINFLKLFFKSINLSKKEKFDLITVPDAYFGGILAFFLSRIMKNALEIQVHGFEKLRGIRKFIAGFVLRKAHSIRVVSNRLKNEITEKYTVTERKITIVPIFVGGDFRKRAVKNFGDSFVFLYVARLVPVKNIGLGIEAISELPKENKAELWIVGDGPLEKSLKSKVKSLKLEDKIKFFGRRENIFDFYEKADALLLTSFSEGWPLVTFEALSCGLPIIMTPVGQAGEILKNEENSLIVPQNDKQALINAMTLLVTDSGLRQKLSLGAEQTFKSLPTKEEILKKYLESWQKSIHEYTKTKPIIYK